MRYLGRFGPGHMAALIAGAVFSALLSAQAAAAFGHSPRAGWMAPGAANIADLLYVSDASTSTVLVYSNDTHPKLVGQITDGLSSPVGMSVDSHGDLYVANSLANDVTVYHHGATSPFFTISHGLQSPDSVAVANDGSVYVADFSGDVLEYHPRATRPFYRIPKMPGGSSSSFVYPADIGVDGEGTLYVYYESDTNYVSEGFVIKYKSANRVGTQLPFISTTHANGIDLDRSENVAVGWEGSTRGNPGIAVYAPSGRQIAAWDSRRNIGALRLGADEWQIYATGIDDDTVLVYSYPDGHLLRRIHTPIRGVSTMGLAVSPGHLH